MTWFITLHRKFQGSYLLNEAVEEPQKLAVVSKLARTVFSILQARYAERTDIADELEKDSCTEASASNNAEGESSEDDKFAKNSRRDEKFAKNRGGSVKFAQVRETDAYIFYDFEFLYPVDKSLPRPGSREAENMVELYTLTVAKGRLWSVKVTSNDKLFDAKHEKSLRAPIASFVPRL